MAEPGDKRQPAIVPTAQIHDDRHQVALWRLAAVEQYLYDTMNGDHESDRMTPDPMPKLAIEQVREAQQCIRRAIREGQRTRRSCIGGEMELAERWAAGMRTTGGIDG